MKERKKKISFRCEWTFFSSRKSTATGPRIVDGLNLVFSFCIKMMEGEEGSRRIEKFILQTKSLFPYPLMNPERNLAH